MDIEFHYYMTYLIAARAGFAPGEAAIIAQAAQGVDDNHIPLEVGGGTAPPYNNAISQTMDIVRPHHDLRIYPVFHFIPGDPEAPTARRRDGVRDIWVTTPDNAVANEMIDAALASRNLYRIGVSAHGYCDTWAHQNFVGKDDAFNVLPNDPGGIFGDLSQAALNRVLRIGHAPARHKPDWPALVWQDGRLVDELASVDNKPRFLDAARQLFAKLRRYKTGATPDATLQQQADALAADLAADIGERDDTNAGRPARIARYLKRALDPAYGGVAMPDYVEGRWSDGALVETRDGLAAWLTETVANDCGTFGDVMRLGRRARCTWKHPGQYAQTDWYKFQEAVKAHLEECWTILTRRIPEIAQ